MSSASGAALEAKLQAATSAYTKLESDYARAVEARQLLDAQKTENEGVKKELASLTPNNKVYKLVGPVLMKQEQEEAKHNVDKRLEWINDEMYVSLSSDLVRFRSGPTRRRLLHRVVQHENGIVSDKRAETKLKDVSSKLEEKKGEARLLTRGPFIVNLQGQYQQQLQAAGGAGDAKKAPAVAAA
ncbi:Prefoldin subunit 6 [Rhodotorula sphaerocarpa]